tara:strand:- start:2005 stop:3159 length:1155 start_codon:yes stop_codon:yes gene_type:complete
MSYDECCDLLFNSNIKINNLNSIINYNNIDCLQLSFRELYNYIKTNNLIISKYKLNMCKQLIDNGYIFKDVSLINKQYSTNNSKLNYTNNKNNILFDENLDLPINLLILKYGIKIKTLENNYLYIIPDKLSNIIINNITKTINIGFINRNIQNIILKYITLNYSNYKSGILLEPKYNDTIPDIEYIINSHHKQPTLPKKNIIYAKNYYNKFSPNVWAKKYCSNYNENNLNKKNMCNDSIALKNDIVCIQDINGNNIKSNNLIKLLNNNCISKSDYKLQNNLLTQQITPIKYYGNIKKQDILEINKWAKNNCSNYDNNCNINETKKENKLCVKNNYTNKYISKNNIVKIQNETECFDINDLENLIKFNQVELTDYETTFLNTINN